MEFSLAGLGLMDRSQMLRAGRWVRADWAICGRISTNSATGRTISIEIIDLQHADKLADTKLRMPQASFAFRLEVDDISNLVQAIKATLEQAKTIENGNRDRKNL